MQTTLDITVPTVNKHEEEIRSWDWAGLKADAQREPYQNDGPFAEEDGWFGSTFLGTVFAIMPSGKFYLPWACSHVDEEEAEADEEFMEALEKVAEEHGMWVTSGEGDPCDMFLCCHCDIPTDEEE